MGYPFLEGHVKKVKNTGTPFLTGFWRDRVGIRGISVFEKTRKKVKKGVVFGHPKNGVTKTER